MARPVFALDRAQWRRWCLFCHKVLDLGEPSVFSHSSLLDFKVNVTFFSAYDFGREYDSVVSAVPGSKDYLLLSSPAHTSVRPCVLCGQKCFQVTRGPVAGTKLGLSCH